jgi:hypothetical protein
MKDWMEARSEVEREESEHTLYTGDVLSVKYKRERGR